MLLQRICEQLLKRKIWKYGEYRLLEARFSFILKFKKLSLSTVVSITFKIKIGIKTVSLKYIVYILYIVIYSQYSLVYINILKN